MSEILDFGQIVRMIRKDRNYTQTKMAQLLGTATSTISMYECNERLPDYDMMLKLSDVLNVSMDVLYGKQSYVPTGETENEKEKELKMSTEETVRKTMTATKAKKEQTPKRRLEQSDAAQRYVNTPERPHYRYAPTARTVTKHESDLLDAYRAHPEMQSAVDKILDIEEPDTVTLYAAAYTDENRADEYVTVSKSEWKRLQNLPDTDQEL